MKIAISTDGGYVSAHFGRCPIFTIIEVLDGKVRQQYTLDNPGHAPGAIPEFLHQKGVECIVAGGMGQRAKILFQEYGIETILGIDGNIDDAIEKIENDILEGKESLCTPGGGKGYGIDKEVCDHGENGHQH